jgi:hypothetical protein
MEAIYSSKMFCNSCYTARRLESRRKYAVSHHDQLKISNKEYLTKYAS